MLLINNNNFFKFANYMNNRVIVRTSYNSNKD